MSSAPATQVHATPATGLLGMRPEHFLRDYWQKRPLLIRNAFPDFISPLQPEDLAGLACEEGALARIASYDRARDSWTLETGPFSEDSFPRRPPRDWTLLVQDVDKWDADVRALLDEFRFLPSWRMDDIMVSFAAPGGSVGAHIDNYDVFLLQAHGHRRWQIDTRANPDASYRDDVPLRLLKTFNPDHDWVLAPGDMLYLPPGVPHHGVAEDACLTISVGLRAPSAAELIEAQADYLTFNADERIRYTDADLVLPADAHEITQDAIQRARTAMQQFALDDTAFADFFGRFISAYRVAEGMAASPETAAGRDILTALARGETWERHPYTRIAWHRNNDGAALFANGQRLEVSIDAARALADAQSVDAQFLARLDTTGREALAALARNGHFLPLEDA